MGKEVVVIGAVAIGPKAACRIKRIAPDTRVTLIDKDSHISYGGCGIPYYIGGDVAELDALYSTSAHVPRDSSYFENVKGVNVKIRTEALSIDKKNKTVKIRDLDNKKEEDIKYDKLVIATGATPVIPPLPGVNLPGVTAIATMHHAKTIKDMVSKGQVENAVVIGGGAIGLEIAEALTDLWGIDTTLVEMMDQLLPTVVGRDMALPIKNHMEEKGVKILLSEKVTKIIGDEENGVKGVETSNSTISCNLVIFAAGVRPNSRLAHDAGLAIGSLGGILVDENLRTSDPDIYAGGDCIEIRNTVNGQNIHLPLGSLANRQGRVIGTNIAGKGCSRFKGGVGTFCIKVFELGLAKTGLTVKQARASGFDVIYSVVVQPDRAHFYPTQELMYMKLIADRKTRRILGAEAFGPQGDAVKARIDAIASLLQYGADIDAISNLEVAYAPPFASAMDIINNAANSLDNIIEGIHDPIDAIDFISDFKNSNTRVLDVRSPVQAGPFVEKYGNRWINIDQNILASRLNEIPKDEKLYLICGSGPRSYEAQLLLRSKGINKNTKNIQGGVGMIKQTDYDFAP